MSSFNSYQKKLIFFACFIVVITLMAMDFINPSLPYIMQDFSNSQNTIKGLVVMYLIIFGLAQLFYGAFSDNYGRKKTMIIALIIATSGFILSALSTNITMLYIARFITALGTAGGPVISRSIISDVCHDAPALKKAFSYYSVCSQLSPGLAPVCGGFIQEYVSWHFSFMVLALLNLFSLYFFFKVMPESHVLPTIKNSLAAQLKIYLKLLKLIQFQLFNFLSASILVFTVVYYSFSPFIFYKMGISPVMNGLLNTVYAVGLATGAFVLLRILHKYNSQKTYISCILAYILLCVSAMILFLFWSNVFLIAIFAFLLAFICGIAAPLTMSFCMEGFHENKGAASAVQSFVKLSFSGIIILGFSFITLNNFIELIIIFLIVSIFILLLYGTNYLLLYKKIKINIIHKTSDQATY